MHPYRQPAEKPEKNVSVTVVGTSNQSFNIVPIPISIIALFICVAVIIYSALSSLL